LAGCELVFLLFSAHCERNELGGVAVEWLWLWVGMWDILGLAGEMELDSLLDMYWCYYLMDIFSLIFYTELCVSESLWIEICALCRATLRWVLLPWDLVLRVWCLSQFNLYFWCCSVHIHLKWLWGQTVVPVYLSSEVGVKSKYDCNQINFQC